MADLKPLIRHRKHIVDQKQKFLAELYRQAEELQEKKEALQEQIDGEIRLAEKMNDAQTQTYLGHYLEGARHKMQDIDDSIEQMNVRIEAAREEVRLAFADMKKIEITQRQREEREEEELRKKEDKELDEIGLDVYRRRQEKQEAE